MWGRDLEGGRGITGDRREREEPGREGKQNVLCACMRLLKTQIQSGGKNL